MLKVNDFFCGCGGMAEDCRSYVGANMEFVKYKNNREGKGKMKTKKCELDKMQEKLKRMDAKIDALAEAVNKMLSDDLSQTAELKEIIEAIKKVSSDTDFHELGPYGR